MTAHSVDLGLVGPGAFVALPWCDAAAEVDVRYEGLTSTPITRGFRLAGGAVDRWRIVPLPGVEGRGVVLSSSSGAIARTRMVSVPQTLTGTVHGVVLPFGEAYAVLSSARRQGITTLELACDLLGSGSRADVVRLSSRDGMNWELDGVTFDARNATEVGVMRLPCRPTPEGTLVCLLGATEERHVESLRVWERQLNATAAGVVEVPLRFRVIPGVWPEIQLTCPEGTISDVAASAYEVRLRCDPGLSGALGIDLAGFRISLTGRSVTTVEGEFTVPGSGPISIALYLQGADAALCVDDLAPRLLTAASSNPGTTVVPVTSNVSNFTLASGPPIVGTVHVDPEVELHEAVLYGLREPRSSIYRAALEETGGPGELFYSSRRFAVHDRWVVEIDGSDPAALVTDSATIVSPVRVIEEFVWRDNPFGDMTRVVDRKEVWRSAVEPGRFLELETPFRSVNAAFRLALETFQRNSTGEFALPGESGLWSAGYFQGPGLGFGSWKRDTSHVALGSGNLLDPGTARASLAHVVNGGFDNGSDGDSLPVVAVWDYLLATGDESLILETWPRLTGMASSLDARFDEKRGLVVAAQATSNDCFEEPEAGGYALSTQVYSMQTYAALSGMARLPGVRDPRAEEWAARGAAMSTAIIEQYWNPVHGYFTSGPVGSESYSKGYWETSGAEAALWGFLGPEAEARAAATLKKLPAVAMSAYGTVLFPYKNADNHFCGSVWYCWQAGIARAAARFGDARLVHQLIGQQVRTIVRNKTFYEVTDAATGHSWRWPGQLWHAAGFASLVLFGLLGIRYDLDGMTFTPAVTSQLDGTRVHGMRYRAAVLDVEIRGHGTRCELVLDGRTVDRIPLDVTGRHTVVLAVR